MHMKAKYGYGHLHMAVAHLATCHPCHRPHLGLMRGEALLVSLIVTLTVTLTLG